jgi:hypothetical protein
MYAGLIQVLVRGFVGVVHVNKAFSAPGTKRIRRHRIFHGPQSDGRLWSLSRVVFPAESVAARSKIRLKVPPGFVNKVRGAAVDVQALPVLEMGR